jgi:hypothetical protein
MVIQKTIQVNAPASKIWEVLWDNYSQVCDWASTVNTSDKRKVSGNKAGGRTCVSTWGEISEIVDFLDEKNMTYKYYADGLPSMMKSAQNQWKVTSKSVNTSEVSIDLEIEFATLPKILMGWMIVPKMKKDINQTLEDLKFFVETGKQTEAKIKSDVKFFKKNKKIVA